MGEVAIALPSEVMERLLVPLQLIKLLGKVEGKTRFQKLVFLSQKEYGLKELYEFQKHHYGPYSFELSEDLELLQRLGYVSVEKTLFLSTNSESQGKFFVYSLTDKGNEITASNMNQQIIEPLKNVSKVWGKKSLEELISYVYKKYVK